MQKFFFRFEAGSNTLQILWLPICLYFQLKLILRAFVPSTQNIKIWNVHFYLSVCNRNIYVFFYLPICLDSCIFSAHISGDEKPKVTNLENWTRFKHLHRVSKFHKLLKRNIESAKSFVFQRTELSISKRWAINRVHNALELILHLTIRDTYKYIYTNTYDV